MMNFFSIINVDPVFQYSHHVEVGSVADVSEVHAASIFRLEVSRVSQCLCYIGWWSWWIQWGKGAGA
jgi:hypothetical protein